MSFARRLLLSLSLLLLLGACEDSEERAERYFRSGLELREAGDLARAAVEFRNVFRFDGAHKEARASLAEVLIEQGNPNGAYSQYLRLAEQYPEDAEIRLALSNLAIAQGVWSEVRRHGAVAVKVAPEDPRIRAIDAMLSYIEGTETEDMAAREAAAARAETLLAKHPDLIAARQVLIIHRLETEQYEAGLALIDAALERAPDDLTMNTLKLQVLARLNRPEETEALLLDLHERFPDNEEIERNLIGWYAERNDLGAIEELLRSRAEAESGTLEDQLALVRFLAEAQGVEAARAQLDVLIEAEASTVEAVDRYTILDANYAFTTGDTEAAIETLRARLEDDAETPQTNEIKTALAQILVNSGNPVGARALVEEVLEQDAGHVAALKLHSSWLIEADKPDEAVGALRTALDQAPNDPQILTLMALAHERAGSPQLAGERLALAMNLSGAAPEESLRYAQFLISQDRMAAAREVLDEAVTANPQNLELLTEQARLALSAQDDAGVRATIAALEQIDHPAGEDQATTLRAALLLQQERLDEGLALLESRADDNDGSSSAIIDVIRIRLQAGQVEAARSYLDEKLAEAPEDPALRFADASLRMVEGETESAEAALRSLVKDFPQAEEPVRQLYELLRSSGRGEEATALLEEAVEQMPESRNLQLLRAGEFEALGDLQRSLEINARLYEQNSSDPIVANNLASLLSDLNDDEESLAQAAAVAQRLRSSKVPAFQDTYGWITYRQGKYQEALSHLEPAAKALPDNPVVQYHLGMTYLALTRTAEAREYLGRAIELGADMNLPQIAAAREALKGL